ncbi:MAG: xylanase [Flavobacteriaceae bacterium]|nr:xylanase [Flavobacteriaceae bacterium]
MREIKYLLISSFFFVLLFACNNDSDEREEPEIDFLEIKIKPNTVYQTIHAFGASDAWITQYVGKNWPLQKRDQIADLLFSKEFNTNGNPKGIGLNNWRFNIGAGSFYQGGNSGISDIWRRAESFMYNGIYNWEAQEGQRWFLNAAKLRGVNHFTAFSNSPPVDLTKNGKAHSSGGAAANLSIENYGKYADFLVEVVKQMKNNYGIEFDNISPFNEPQWDWKGGQEGTPWLNDEIANVSKVLDAKLQEQNLNTKIEIAESGKLNYLYENADKTGRASQIQEFFDSSSANYIGDLASMNHKIAGHSYYTTHGTATLIDVRRKVLSEIRNVDPSLEFLMTEYCILENNSEINGNGRDLGIDAALYLARVIHADLTVANASSWSWWLAVSPYDYKDGLVYIDNDKNDGQVYDSKLLWAFGNYSRFIDEGYQRVDLSRSDNQSVDQSINGLLVSAYKSPVGSKIVVVFVNQRNIGIPIKIGIDGKQTYTGKRYQTSAVKGDNLAVKEILSEDSVWTIPSRSLVTIVLE